LFSQSFGRCLPLAGTGLADIDQGLAPSRLGTAHFRFGDGLVGHNCRRGSAGQTHKCQRSGDDAERFHGEFPIMENLKKYFRQSAFIWMSEVIKNDPNEDGLNSK
jgi:hypothetical protein